MEIPGVYGARNHLCDPNKNEMFPGYEKLDFDDMFHKYRAKIAKESYKIMHNNTEVIEDGRDLFDQLEKLNNSIANTSMDNTRIYTPSNPRMTFELGRLQWR